MQTRSEEVDVLSARDDWVASPALCLDLDGTVRFNREQPEGIINHPDQVAVYPDVERKVREYRDRGYLIVGISNQGGVAYGYKTAEGVDAEMAATLACFERDPFHIIKVSFHCEGGTVGPYAYRSLQRKPKYGMLALVEAEAFEAGIVVDWKHSLFVGSGNADRQCAKAAGIEYVDANEFFGRQA